MKRLINFLALLCILLLSVLPVSANETVTVSDTIYITSNQTTTPFASLGYPSFDTARYRVVGSFTKVTLQLNTTAIAGSAKYGVVCKILRNGLKGNPVLNQLSPFALSVGDVDGGPYRATNSRSFDNFFRIPAFSTVVTQNGVERTAWNARAFRLIISYTLELGSRSTDSGTPQCDNHFLLDGVTNQLQVKWCQVSGASYYDLEWAYVGNYRKDGSNYTSMQTTIPDFRFNSTRVSVTNPFYNIPLNYEKGFIVVRYRDVRVLPQHTYYGNWCWQLSNSVTHLDHISDFVYTINNNSPRGRDDLFWQYSASFADSGKRKDEVVYFDGTNRPRENLWRLNTDSNTLGQATVYDFYGRAAIQSLSAPLFNSNGTYIKKLDYYPKLNRNAQGNSYSYTDFDSVPNSTSNCFVDTPSSFSTSSGPSKYFSPFNPDKNGHQAYLPDASGYPFSQTKWVDDNSGRILAQGGVGKALQLGNGHETMYQYASVGQAELDRLFGTDAGLSSNYRKVILTDANGVSNVEYIRNDGKIVATALVGNSPANLESIGGEVADTIKFNFIESATDLIDHETKTTVKFFNLPSDQSCALHYSLQPQRLTIPDCKPQCATCSYKLFITVEDQCNELKIDYVHNLRNSFSACQNNSEAVFDTTILTPFLKAGVYRVTRKLMVDTTGFTSFFQKYLDTLKNCPPPSVSANKDEPVVYTCEMTCKECEQRAEMMKGNEATYNAIIAVCNSKCGRSYYNTLAGVKKQMLDDMSPGGQYAAYCNEGDTSHTYRTFHLSVLTVSDAGNGRLPLPAGPLANWQKPVGGSYKSADGVLTNPATLNVRRLIDQWNANWANQLLDYHPEFGYYRYCNDNKEYLAASISFDEELMKTNTAQAAAAKNYFDLNELVIQDKGIKALGLENQLLYALNNYFSRNNVTIDLKEFVYRSNHCANPLYDDTQAARCAVAYNSVTFGMATDACDPDRDWHTLRALYMATKTKVIEADREKWVRVNNYFSNECIGDSTFNLHTPNQQVYVMPGQQSLLSLWNVSPNDTFYYAPYFRNKIKRFANSQDVYDNTLIQTSSEEKTVADLLALADKNAGSFCEGCEDQNSLQKLLSAVASIGRFYDSDSFDILKCYFPDKRLQDIITAVDSGVELHWIREKESNGDSLVVTLANENKNIVCELRFKQDPTDTLHFLADTHDNRVLWGRLRFFTCLTHDTTTRFFNKPSQNNFFVYAIDDSARTYKLHGYASCFNLKACQKNTDCISNCNQKALNQLLDSVILGVKPNNKFIKALPADSLLSCFLRNNSPQPVTLLINENNFQSSFEVTAAFGSQMSCKLVFRALTPSSNDKKKEVHAFRFVRFIGEDLKSNCDKPVYIVELEMLDKSGTFISRQLYRLSSTCFDDSSCCPVKNTCPQLVVNGGFDDCKQDFYTTLISKSAYNGALDNVRCKCTYNKKEREFLKTDFQRKLASQNKSLCRQLGWRCCSWKKFPCLKHIKNTYELDCANRNLVVSKPTIANTVIWSKSISFYRTGSYVFSVQVKVADNLTAGTLRNLFLVEVNSKQYGMVAAETAPGIFLLQAFIQVDSIPAEYTFAFKTGGTGIQLRNRTFVFDNFGLKPVTCEVCCVQPTTWLPIPNFTKNCEAGEIAVNNYNDKLQQSKNIDSLRERLYYKYVQHCLNALDTLSTDFKGGTYQFTLYYYDQAGNLIRTIPPMGVKPLSRSQTNNIPYRRILGQEQVPGHQMASTYNYNCLNNVTVATSPDAGTVKNYYDRLGRLMLTQNAVQIEGNRYGYMVYDALGRMIESGELEKAGSSFTTAEIDGFRVDGPRFLTAIQGCKRNEVVRVKYDEPLSASVSTYFTASQQLLRNRISATFIIDSIAAGNFTGVYSHATFYSYDAHGNIKEFINHIPALDDIKQGIKKTAYQYDLVSNLVKQIDYQAGQSDQFHHRYLYDADNRLLQVQTATDATRWNVDARYYYYRHGPLARSEIGNDSIQGIDYIYTLQGWLKGINSTVLLISNDPGKDGTNGFLPDLYAYSVGFFDNDYKPISSFASAIAETGSTSCAGNDLFNGNIRHTITSLAPLVGENKIQGYTYRYDQLNRLTNAQAIRGFNESDNNWTGTTLSEAYRMQIAYDANGNITQMLRNADTIGGHSLAMDRLTYNYSIGNNHLLHINDSVNALVYTQDLDNQASNNYGYDRSGNLIKDDAESISRINWNTAGRIKDVIKNGSRIQFSYNASGSRLGKKTGDTIAYYVTDINGDVLATYLRSANNLKWDMSPIYGNGRIGVYNASIVIAGNVNIPLTVNVRGKREYELINHLGDVLLTVSDDRLKAVDGLTDSADVKSYQDYYPFGMTMAARSSESEYRYGIQGKEKDNEIKGPGNSYDFVNRMLDPRVGRWLSVDPKMGEYPNRTPFNAMGNNPVSRIDPTGLEDKEPTKSEPAPKDPYGRNEDTFIGKLRRVLGISGNEEKLNDEGNKGDEMDAERAQNAYAGRGKGVATGAEVLGATAELLNAAIPGPPVTSVEKPSYLRKFGNWLFGTQSTEKISVKVAEEVVPIVGEMPLSIGYAVSSAAGGETLPMQVVRTIQKGEKLADIINEAKGLTFTTGNEHALVTLASGERALVSGGPGGISFSESQIKRIFGHTHPTSAPPSSADAEALKQLGQSKQYVFHGGQVTVVRPK